jgi:hypothetical protein
VPTNIKSTSVFEQPIYQGHMDFPSEALREVDWEKGLLDKQSSLLSPGPIVNLGKLRWWNLATLAHTERKTLSGENAKHLGSGHLYLIEASFSFTPDVDNEVEWAHFIVYLRPYSGLENPIAIGLYPFKTHSPGQQDSVKVALTTNIKFFDIQPLPDWSIAIIEIDEWGSMVTGNITVDTAPSWDFQKFSNQPVRGIQCCYAIIKKPTHTKAVRVTLDIIAKVYTRHGLWNAHISSKDTPHLSQIICTD